MFVPLSTLQQKDISIASDLYRHSVSYSSSAPLSGHTKSQSRQRMRQHSQEEHYFDVTDGRTCGRFLSCWLVVCLFVAVVVFVFFLFVC